MATASRKASKPAPRVVYPSMPVPGKFIVLTVDYQWPEDPLLGPAHPLTVPPDWAQYWDGEWKLESRDFVDREEALQIMQRMNSDNCDDWWLAFEIGEATKDSFLNLGHGAKAEFFLDCSLSVIRPTAEEIKRICYAPKAKGKRGAA